MQYRTLGKTGELVSALGFGCMRFPTLGDDHAVIDQDQAAAMLDAAIAHGVNYLDNGYPYHGGSSERFVGAFLQETRQRDKVLLATKMLVRIVEKPDDYDRLFEEQRERFRTDHFDFYLLHALRGSSWQQSVEFGVIDWLERRRAAGDIRHIGFSFHDDVDAFRSIVDGYDGWEFCQVQYNYMNEDIQAGTAGVRYAAERGLGIVVMEPLLGGRLANPPAAVQAVWDASGRTWSPAEWGLQWLWNKPEVSLVLSGMSSLEQVMENVGAAARSGVGLLTQSDLATVTTARERYNELCPVPCTRCEYCMPCPNGVNIPHNFEVFNEGVMFDVMPEMRRRYLHSEEGARASACIQCRECEPKCPQSIEISAWMPLVHQVLGEGQAYDPAACPQP
ncbi:MAG: aldo/keto reductase [Chloroflexi bacterium]|jgi:predicted aldo/keto reductase-like oxidoreductase|nr:aldo/keto reductase [Chloroflexota bacterium]